MRGARNPPDLTLVFVVIDAAIAARGCSLRATVGPAALVYDLAAVAGRRGGERASGSGRARVATRATAWRRGGADGSDPLLMPMAVAASVR